jgi:hypothetical protein
MSRPRHPKKEVEGAVQYAEEKSWKVDKRGGHTHVWGILNCPERSQDGHRVSVYSTPRNPQNHARHIKKSVDRCEHKKECDE